MVSASLDGFSDADLQSEDLDNDDDSYRAATPHAASSLQPNADFFRREDALRQDAGGVVVLPGSSDEELFEHQPGPIGYARAHRRSELPSHAIRPVEDGPSDAPPLQRQVLRFGVPWALRYGL